MSIDAIYARVSTDAQSKDDKYSLDLQIDRCRDLLSNLSPNGKVQIFKEDYSGYEESRPELDKIKNLIVSGQVKRLLFLRVDRLSRKSSHIDNLRENFFIPYDVEVYSTDLNQWEWTPHQIYMQQTLANFSQLWGTMLKQVMMDGKLSLLDKGSVMTFGRPPLGYTEIKNEVTNIRSLEINPLESCIVRDIFQWFVYDRLSLHAIARRLHKNKTPTYSELRGFNTFKAGWKNPNKKARWNYVTVRDILSNRTYKGEWTWGKKKSSKHTQVIDVPAIIDDNTFNLAQKYLADNKRRKHKELGRKSDSSYLMAKRLKCTCDYTMTTKKTGYTPKEGKRRYYKFYACYSQNNKQQNHLCSDGHRFKTEDIDRIAWHWLREIMFNREYLEYKVNNYLDEQQAKVKPLRERIAQYTELKKKAESRRERLLDLYLDNTEMSKEMLTGKQKELDDQINDYSAELAELKMKLSQIDLIEDRARWEDDFWGSVDMFYRDFQEDEDLGNKQQKRFFEKFDVRGAIVEITNGIAKPSVYQKQVKEGMEDGLYILLTCKFNITDGIKTEFFVKKLDFSRASLSFRQNLILDFSDLLRIDLKQLQSA